MPISKKALQRGRPPRTEVDDPARAQVLKPSNRVFERIRDLEESEQLLRTTLEQMDQGLVLLDQNQTVRLANPRALELLSLTKEVLHTNAAFCDIRAFQNARGDFSLIPPSTVSIISSSDVRLFPLIYDWPRPDGKILEVRRVQLSDGSSINTFTDVTERRAAEAAVYESERQCRLLSERVEELSQIDELTGFLNRRYIMRALNDEMARAQRSAEPCSIAIIDLDFFKRINDRFGHPIGDEVLRSFAIAASVNSREIDKLGRYGGEEFLLVLPHTSSEQAAAVVDRLRKMVADLDWTSVSDSLVVTISAGVTQNCLNEATDEILARADAALYRAKDAGRNCVVRA